MYLFFITVVASVPYSITFARIVMSQKRRLQKKFVFLDFYISGSL